MEKGDGRLFADKAENGKDRPLLSLAPDPVLGQGGDRNQQSWRAQFLQEEQESPPHVCHLGVYHES
jgi:hypothetical protein